MIASTARRFVGSLASPRQDKTTSSEIAVNVNAVQRARRGSIPNCSLWQKLYATTIRLKAE
jgi:hypothetical protein